MNRPPDALQRSFFLAIAAPFVGLLPVAGLAHFTPQDQTSRGQFQTRNQTRREVFGPGWESKMAASTETTRPSGFPEGLEEWRRGESNPGPDVLQRRRLRVYPAYFGACAPFRPLSS